MHDTVKISHYNRHIENAEMLISDSHQFIFVRMRKAASTSMQSVLRPLCIAAPEGRFARLKSRTRLERDYRRRAFRLHESIRAAQRCMPPATFACYFKFAFVRNPWERLVSEYEFILGQTAHGRHRKVKRLNNFIDFIHMQSKRKDAYQLNMLDDGKGRLLVDFVGKLENLADDWRIVCERIGLPHQDLPRHNVTAHAPYQDYYDSRGRQLVARHWAREIELFGYSYD